MVDYESLYRDHIQQFKISHDGIQAIGICPFHNDRHPSLSMNLETGLYYCHSCSAKGNAYQFATLMNVPDPKVWSDNSDTLINKGDVLPVPLVDFWDLAKSYQNNLPAEWLDHNPCAKGMLVGRDKQGRMTFPYFNEDGIATGIKHHKGLNGLKPYWEGDGTCKFYGLQLIKGFDRKEQLIICEGEKDCLTLLMKGIQATCGSAGAKGIPKDLSPIEGFNEYLILLDKDTPGYEGSQFWAKQIGGQEWLK
jgi:hypothetical protein